MLFKFLISLFLVVESIFYEGFLLLLELQKTCPTNLSAWMTEGFPTGDVQTQPVEILKPMDPEAPMLSLD